MMLRNRLSAILLAALATAGPATAAMPPLDHPIQGRQYAVCQAYRKVEAQGDRRLMAHYLGLYLELTEQLRKMRLASTCTIP